MATPRPTALAPVALVLAALFLPIAGHAAVFTYQGRLDEGGAPKTGTVDLRFDAFSLESGGGALNAVPVIRDGVPLTDGVFTVEVEFGANVFTGAPVFVQVSVREDVAGDASTPTGFTNLVPRQAVTATPYAQHAANVGTDAVSSVQIANGSITASDANTTSTSDGLQRRVSDTCAVNSAVRVINSDGTVVCDTDDVGAGAAAWGLAGNSGTDPTTNFIGTTDAQAIEFRGNNQRVARLESIPITVGHAANVLLGSPANLIDVGVRGATISGGGTPSGNTDFIFGSEGPNRVSDDYGAVGGGVKNTAGDAGSGPTQVFATVSGGFSNTASNSASTVGGGANNSASGTRGTVGGGSFNVASGIQSTVGGGNGNTASGFASIVGGGNGNIASGIESTVSGGIGNAASGLDSTASGGFGNTAFGHNSTVGGGSSNCAGGISSWAGGNRAKVRPLQGAGTDLAGSGCDNVENTTDANGDEGSFVWADSLAGAGDFVSKGPNQFLIRANGGVGIQPGTGALAAELANVPEAPLHVFERSAGTVTANANSIVVFEDAGSGYISLLTPGTGVTEGGLLFGEPANAQDGGIVYQANNTMQLRTNGNVSRLAIEGDGDVGIGTGVAAVNNRFHVLGGGPGSIVLLESSATTLPNSLLDLKSAVTGNVDDNTNFVRFFDGDSDPTGAIEGNGAGGVVYKTAGADYAEWLPRIDASEVIEAGDVVGLFPGGKVSKRIEGAIQILIVSTGAAVAGNSPGESAEATHTLIAFVGQVQARVCGPVRAGDAIVANEDGSGCGVARDPKQLAAPEFARVAGTAWEDAAGDGEHRVRVAVGLGEGGTERAAMLARIDALEAKLSTQQALVDALLAREARAVVTAAR